MSADPIDQKHYTIPELAKLLNAHPETIRRAAARGDLRSVRVGAERRIPESAAMDWIHGRGRDKDAA